MPAAAGRGVFTEMDEVGKSLAADRKRAAKKTAKPGEGDRATATSPRRSVERFQLVMDIS